MRKKIVALVLVAVLALGVIPAIAAVGDYLGSATITTSSTNYDFTTTRSFVWIKNDGATNSVYIIWYKNGDTLPGAGTISTGGFEIKPGESFTRESKTGTRTFQGVVLYTAASTTAVRILAGDN